ARRRVPRSGNQRSRPLLARRAPAQRRSLSEDLMPFRLSANDAGFGERFAAFLDTKREASADVESTVRKIIADVAERGDRALIEYSKQLARVDLEKLGMKVKPAEIDAALDSTDRKTRAALELA